MKKKNKKKIVITGSEGLIGRILVKTLKNDYNVICLDKKLGHDLSNNEFVESWFKDNKGIYGLIVLHAYNPVPSKRTIKIEPIDVSLDEVRNYFEINTLSVFNVCKNFIKNNKRGVIINITSLYSEVSPKHHIYKNFVKPIAYSISKGGVVSMSRYLATYYSPNFRINTVVFGGVKDRGQDSYFVKKYSENTPIKRLMDPEEVPSVFRFLLDEKSSYMVGTEIIVDGGWMAW